MSAIDEYTINPKLDLVLERTVDVSPELVWEAWTEPEHLKEFFCPRPWSIAEVRVDLKPGGEMYFVMQSPEGELFPNTGCYLELVENRKLVWTSALQPGYAPMPEPKNGAGLFFSAIVLMEPAGTGTRYTAIARHRDEKDAVTHAEMGFEGGWSTVLDQLVEHMKKVAH